MKQMGDRENYIIESFEKINEQMQKEKTNNSLRKKIKKCFKVKEIKRLIIKLYRNTKCKMLRLENKAIKDNDMQYKKYDGNKRIIIYTCIAGKYDKLLEPYYLDTKCDYVVYTDIQDIESKIYKILQIPENIKKEDNNVLINRYIKMHPHELFGQNYDYSIYIDGNIQQVSNLSSFVNCIDDEVGISMHNHSIRNCIYDEAKILKIYKKGNFKHVDEQINRYKQEGFPKKYGMAEAGIIVTDLKNENAKKILLNWWHEFIKTKSYRDQLSLIYTLWKMNIQTSKITTLGKNIRKNFKIQIINHEQRRI